MELTNEALEKIMEEIGEITSIKRNGKDVPIFILETDFIKKYPLLFHLIIEFITTNGRKMDIGLRWGEK